MQKSKKVKEMDELETLRLENARLRERLAQFDKCTIDDIGEFIGASSVADRNLEFARSVKRRQEHKRGEYGG